VPNQSKRRASSRKQGRVRVPRYKEIIQARQDEDLRRRQVVLSRLANLARHGHLATLEQFADGMFARVFQEAADSGRRAG
jgi:hypothetical protein